MIIFLKICSSVPNQPLSSNGELQSPHPQGQKYVAYVRNSGENAKEHAFRIQNIDLDNDSGVYECLVKYKDEIVDKKRQKVEVVTEELMPFTTTLAYKNQENTEEPKTLSSIKKLMCHEERKAKSFDRGKVLGQFSVLHTFM